MNNFHEYIVLMSKSMNFLNAISNKRTLVVYYHGAAGTSGAAGTHRTSRAHGTLGTN